MQATPVGATRPVGYFYWSCGSTGISELQLLLLLTIQEQADPFDTSSSLECHLASSWAYVAPQVHLNAHMVLVVSLDIVVGRPDVCCTTDKHG